VKTVLDDRKIDAVILCIMFASANRSAAGVLANLLLERKTNKPILCCFSAPAGIWDDEIKQLEESGIPNYPTPERAAKALSILYKFSKRKG
jgi:acyl-CoA synthetase (NDP forming)